MAETRIEEIGKPVRFGLECGICGEFFTIYDRNETWRICPECTKRLKNLLYGRTDNG